jgi:hypothetical protein
MDATTIVFWCLVGALISGVIGHMRGISVGGSMLVGVFLGPLLGPLAVMLLSLGGKKAVSESGSPTQPERQP